MIWSGTELRRQRMEKAIALHLMPFQDIHFNSISSSGGEMSRVYPHLLLLIAGCYTVHCMRQFHEPYYCRRFWPLQGNRHAQDIGCVPGTAGDTALGRSRTGLSAGPCSRNSDHLSYPAGIMTLFNNHISLTVLKQPLLLLALLLSFLVVTSLPAAIPPG